MTKHIIAATRLHFGLLSVPVEGTDSDRPQFGGLGLMIDQPRITIDAEPAKAWSFTGTLSERAHSYAFRLPFETPYAIHTDGPKEHIGLGVGTALGMAMAKLCDPHGDLAALCGRGLRSGIGVHGFTHGGLVIDHGKHPDEIRSYCESLPFPWRVVVMRPKTQSPLWHGEMEKRAFAAPHDSQQLDEVYQRLHDLIHQSIKPSLIAQEFDTFTHSLGEYNRLAGQPFAAMQGGDYSSPEATALIDHLRAMGLRGVGQSSWGPTVFAMVQDEKQGHNVIRSLSDWPLESCHLTSGVNISH